MSTHILSDIEALCDEVAILRGGKLNASGNLSELLSASEDVRLLEVNIEGVSADAIRDEIDFIAGAELTAKPNGVTIQVADEADIDAVLQITRKAGGRLVSVHPVKQSLEDLFVRTS